MRAFYRLILLSLVVPTALMAQKRCTKGIPCGNTCIAANKVCRVGSGTPTPAAGVAPRATRTDTAAVAGASSPWVASSIGRTYYRNGCAGASRLAKRNLIWFPTEDSAQAAGFKRSTARGC